MLNNIIVNRIFIALKNKLKDGDIIFAKREDKLIHAFIWRQNPKNIKQNLIHVKFCGLVYTDMKDWIKDRFLEILPWKYLG